MSKVASIVFLFCATTAIASPAQTFTTLINFNYPTPDGAEPGGGLILGLDGNLYGSTGFGGANLSQCTGGCGTIFKMTTAGTLATLISFDGTDGAHGAVLMQANDGNFYGISPFTGTIFRLAPGGTLTLLHTFDATYSPGFLSISPLVQATDGNFYGTTEAGGVTGPASGTVYKITPGGTLTTLHSFCPQAGCTDGANPIGALVETSDGNLYGTTSGGGAFGAGTVFKITLGGTLTTLYSFCSITSCADGQVPLAALVQASDGNLYGTTSEGGIPGLCTGSSNPVGGCGTFFKITPAGTLTTLHTFDGTDGLVPAGLFQGSDGNFYGGARGGTFACGSVGCGTIFRISPAGTLSSLHSFNYTDGEAVTGLVQGADGNLYGVTIQGGTNGYGTAFSLSTGLGPVTATPLFSIASGTYTSTQTVALSDVTPGATIYYTTDKTTPTIGSTTYTGPITINSSETIRAIAATPGFSNSAVAIAIYTINLPPAPTPSFSVPTGAYTSVQSVTISDATIGATIYYTTDGTTPTTASTLYTGPITVNSTETIEAIAIATGFAASPVATATYTINLPPPDFQLSANPTALTLVAGQTGKATFTVTPQNGFNSQVNFSCSGFFPEGTCSFTPTSVTPNGAAASSTLTVTTTAPSAAAMWVPILPSQRPLSAPLFPVLALVLATTFAIATRSRPALPRVPLFATLILLALASGLTSCGGSTSSVGQGDPGTPAGNYTITVSTSTTGAGQIGHDLNFTITVTH